MWIYNLELMIDKFSDDLLKKRRISKETFGQCYQSVLSMHLTS